MGSFRRKSSVGYSVAMLISVAYFMLFAPGTVGTSEAALVAGSSAVVLAACTGWGIGVWYRPVSGERPTYELVACPVLIALFSLCGGIIVMAGWSLATGESVPNVWLAIAVTLYFGIFAFLSVSWPVALASFGAVAIWLAWLSRSAPNNSFKPTPLRGAA